VKNVLFGVLATSALLIGPGVLPAQAAGSAYAGGCFVEHSADGGALYSATVLYSTTPGDNPVSADVTCSWYVNGVLQDAVTFPGTGVVLDRYLVWYEAQITDTVTVCTSVDFTSNADPTQTSCLPNTDPIDLVVGASGAVDPTLCPILASRSPGLFGGVVQITPTGDTYVLGNFFWDCPPYGS
jgi:hypothetical protein